MTPQTALLIIDVQQGLCQGEGRAWQTDELIARINQVSALARRAGAPVFFIQHESGSGYLTHGSTDWQLADGLDVHDGDERLRKTTPDAFLGTPLQERLKAQGVSALVVCGMHTEFCIDTTVRRALALGYPVTLVRDGHTSAGNAVLTPQQVIAHHNATLSNIASFGPRVTLTPAADLSHQK